MRDRHIVSVDKVRLFLGNERIVPGNVANQLMAEKIEIDPCG